MRIRNNKITILEIKMKYLIKYYNLTFILFPVCCIPALAIVLASPHPHQPSFPLL